MNQLIKYLVWPVFMAPAAYLALLWEKLPEKVPMHYNIKGEVDRLGDKSELLLLIGVLSVVNIGLYFLLVNINRIDPKKKYRKENLPKMRSLAFVITLFLSGIACFILYSCRHAGMKFNSNLVVLAIGLLFTIIGNYLYTIKPNYFAGIRTPWALENEENWRQTHQLGGKLWFGGGLVIAAAALLLKDTALFIVMMAVILVLVVVPIIYSYRIYAHTKTNGKGDAE
jgi:uncharacterized membrane protein